MLELGPELNEKSAAWYRAIFGEGALDRKTKEIVGVAAPLTAAVVPERRPTRRKRAGLASATRRFEKQRQLPR